MSFKKNKKNKPGRLSLKEMRDTINKKAGHNLAYDLTESNPTEVTEWIPTGCTWLDGIICRGKRAGYPVGKIVEIAGLESTGKSYLAVQAALNAQKKDIDVIYFDAESAIDPHFLEAAGVDMDRFLYVQASSVEFVLETIEDLISQNDNKMLFIWDSLALTPTGTDIETDFDPLSSVAVKARILSKGFQRLTIPIADSQSTLLILNQLKTNIGVLNPKYAAMSDKYFTPGGKSPAYAYSLRIWLTGSKAKSSFVEDANGFRIGSNVRATLEKSRFGTQGRGCEFKILWGDPSTVGVQDEESILAAIQTSEHVDIAKKPTPTSKVTINYSDGKVEVVRYQDWAKTLSTNQKLKQRVMEILDEEVVLKFDRRQGNASQFYGEEEVEQDEQEN